MRKCELKKIYCSSNENETRFAVIENGKLVNLMIENESDKSILGNIYLGRVEMIAKGMEHAFVNIGIDKNAYLRETNMTNLLQGQYVYVQVKKDDTNGKGVRVTTNIEFSGKYLVYMPYDSTVAVSKKIKNSNWKEIGKSWCEGTEGVIFRSSCLNADERIVEEEFKQFKEIFQSFSSVKKKPKLIYEEESKFITYVQNINDIESIEVDDFDLVNKCREIVDAEKVKFYREKENIFSKYLLDIEIQNALKKRANLENGSFLLFEQVETMTVIDVNSGSFSGKLDKESTALEINKMACKEIVRQLKIRNIGGMICIDFINMKKNENQKMIKQMIISETKIDDVKYNVYDFTRLGLFELTRERTGKTLKELHMADCPSCNGTGEIVSVEERANELMRRLDERTDDELVVEVTEDILARVKNKYVDVKFVVIEHALPKFEVKI